MSCGSRKVPKKQGTFRDPAEVIPFLNYIERITSGSIQIMIIRYCPARFFKESYRSPYDKLKTVMQRGQPFGLGSPVRRAAFLCFTP
jgi:hypothetical protein